MPELPDVVVYLDALERLIGQRQVRKVIVKSPFVIRSTYPEIYAVEDCRVESFSRMGKRILWHFDNGITLVFHLMIAGRFHKRKAGALARGKNDLVSFQFDDFSLLLTEASKKRRASIHVADNPEEIGKLNPLGLEPLECSLEKFLTVFSKETRTLKRFLTDPHQMSGIGNAYSDEILHRCGLSPLRRANQLDKYEQAKLYDAMRGVLTEWIDRLRQQVGETFPEKVTAFRPEMAVHGQFGKPCPVCGDKVQRIVRAESDFNYCPGCQTGGKLLKDRSLSRLLKEDWGR